MGLVRDALCVIPALFADSPDTYWARNPVPKGYNIEEEYRRFKEWGGVDWN